jgi:hypothetical protein
LASEIEQFGMGLRGISTAAQADSLFANTPVINMLNTKYVVYHPDGMPLYNSHAMGNAWLINDIHWCQSANEEMLLLHQKDLHKTAGIDTCFKALFEQNVYNNHLGSITLTSYKPNQLEYRFSSSEPQVAVFSEIYYYTGWKAYINGQEVPHCRANYVLRAMPLPAGNYDIVFKFEPQSYQIGKILTIICSLLLTLAFGYIIFAKFKKQAQ